MRPTIVTMAILGLAEIGGGICACASITRGWQCVPSVIRNDGLDVFQVEVSCKGPVTGVSMTAVSPRIIPPAAPLCVLRDDGLGADRVAGDYVFSAGPFRYDSTWPMPANYLSDPDSPAGLDSVPVGKIIVTELDGTTTSFLIAPQVGVLRSDIPPSQTAALTADIVVTRHLVNIRSGANEVQCFLRETGGDLRNLTRPILETLPDGTDFFLFLSTDKVERLPHSSPQNFAAGRHASVQINYTGTGQSMFDDAASYGSRGRLLGVNALDVGSRGITGRVAMHELLHQWSLFTDSTMELSDGAGHYTARSSGASLLGGFAWSDDGAGGWILDCTEGTNGAFHASPLDKYMMGLIDGQQVGPLRAYAGTGALSLFRCGQVIPDLATTVTIEDIQRVHGVRMPGPGAARRDFVVTFVVETCSRLLNPTEMTYYDILARHFTEPIPAGRPDPYVGNNWVSIQRFFGEGSAWSTVIPREADFDADADVDLTDFAHFADCFNGPNRLPGASGCYDADLDRDGDVDFEDFSIVQACFNGPNRPSACSEL